MRVLFPAVLICSLSFLMFVSCGKSLYVAPELGGQGGSNSDPGGDDGGDDPPPNSGLSINLISAADTGTYDTDNVTSLNQPTFQGEAEGNVTVSILANGEIVGFGTADSEGNFLITTVPMDDGEYQIRSAYEDSQGVDQFSTAITVWIDTIEPDTPNLDLDAGSDSGRSDIDNITNINRPLVHVSAHDPYPNGENPEAHALRYRVYVRVEGLLDELIVIDSFAALTQLVSGGLRGHIIAVGLNNPLGPALIDGINVLRVEVEDRAGNVSASGELSITIDTN